jgi:transposase-like protein
MAMALRRFASDTVSHDLRSRGPESYPADVVRGQAREKTASPQLLSCSHCASGRIVRWGAAHGLPRYRCLACRRTFNILTNTPLARLRNRERWLTYVGTMFEGKSIRGSANACAVSAATSSRWRRRFMNCTAEQRAKLLGTIVAAYANAPEVIGTSEQMNSANLSWCKELLPVVLSWLV